VYETAQCSMHERKAAVVVCMVMGWDGVQFETGEKVRYCMRVLMKLAETRR